MSIVNLDGKKVSVHCFVCLQEMAWQPTIMEFWCNSCDYLMDWEQVQEISNFVLVDY